MGDVSVGFLLKTKLCAWAHPVRWCVLPSHSDSTFPLLGLVGCVFITCGMGAGSCPFFFHAMLVGYNRRAGLVSMGTARWTRWWLTGLELHVNPKVKTVPYAKVVRGDGGDPSGKNKRVGEMTLDRGLSRRLKDCRKIITLPSEAY